MQGGRHQQQPGPTVISAFLTAASASGASSKASLALYLREAPAVQAVLLAAGLAVAAASVAGTLGVRAAYRRKLKRQ